MTSSLYIVLMCLCVMATPFLIYVCAKLGTYGVLVGRRRFERDFPEKGNDDEEQRQEGT